MRRIEGEVPTYEATPEELGLRLPVLVWSRSEYDTRRFVGWLARCHRAPSLPEAQAVFGWTERRVFAAAQAALLLRLVTRTRRARDDTRPVLPVDLWPGWHLHQTAYQRFAPSWPAALTDTHDL